MKLETLHDNWLSELGAISRGMLFLGGSLATAESMQTVEVLERPRAGAKEQPGARRLVAAALAAALMVAPALGSLAGDTGPYTRTSPRIVDLPAITVRPSAADAAAYRHLRRIVDLDTVVVRPRAVDRAFYLASRQSPPQSLASIDPRR